MKLKTTLNESSAKLAEEFKAGTHITELLRSRSDTIDAVATSL